MNEESSGDEYSEASGHIIIPSIPSSEATTLATGDPSPGEKRRRIHVSERNPYYSYE